MGTKTEQNLKEAFAGESQANRRYLAFSKKAEEEGFAQVAKLFRAAAEAETVHAHNHLRVLKGIRSTKENVQEAIDGETHEFKNMYPEMIEKAKAENNNDARADIPLCQRGRKNPRGSLYKSLAEPRKK